MLPSEAIEDTKEQVRGEPVFIVGSAVAAEAHGRTGFGDVDVFTPSQQILIATVQRLLDQGAALDERYSRVWYRWLRFGLKGWHTNSMQLETLKGTSVNVVLKNVEGHPTTSLSQVLESFDFGLLAMGYDVETDTFRDLRQYLFPDLWQAYELQRMHEAQRRWPMMPNKRSNWVQGFISRYNGLREGYRYAKYHGYGYDLSLVGPDLVTGYRAAALYHHSQYDEEKILLGDIYERIAELIENDELDELTTSYNKLEFTDPLDRIMEALV